MTPKKEIIIRSPENIRKPAREILSLLKGHPVVAFSGEMGAGKTTLIKAICSELGVKDTVSSPTFALVYEYQISKGENIYHFDLYRINEPSELFDLGYEDYFYSGSRCYIEWPEMAEHLLPPGTVKLFIRIGTEGERLVTFEGI